MDGSQLPSGTVIFLFTDIEGSARLIEALGEEAFAAAWARGQSMTADELVAFA